MSKKRLLVILSLLSFLLVAASQSAQQGKISGGVAHEMPSWFTNSFLDISEDVEIAKESDKNLLLFFHLNGCPYCDAMLNENFRGGETTQFLKEKFSVIAVNIKGDREISLTADDTVTEKVLSEQLQIQYTPTLVFLSDENKFVYRTNGYRSPTAFRHVLNYVTDKAYKDMTLSAYIEKNSATSKKYSLIPHSTIKTVKDFKDHSSGPVAILFEDEDCTDCELLHQTILSHKEVIDEVNKLTFVRLDAYSQETIMDFAGNKTTPRKWVEKLDLGYRPGIVLFDNGEEVTRIDGKLFAFHFKEVFRYVSQGMYKRYATYNDYLSVRQEELLNQGVDINIVQ